MDRPWYRNWFHRPAPRHETIPLGVDDDSAEIQFQRGVRFAASPGEAQNYLQAEQWYRKAADQNHPIAQFNLGIMYTRGQGVSRDQAAAAIWFLKAARQGHAGAQFNLGINLQRTSFGESPEKACESKIEAYKWYQLAAAQGYENSAIACDRLTLTMTQEAVTEGNHRAAAFVTVNSSSADNNSHD